MITTYTDLQAELSDFANRTDLVDVTAARTALGLSDGVAATLIQMAESKLRRDHRCRKLQARTFTVSADDTDLPSDFGTPESLYHDGPTYYGPIEIVTPDRLAQVKELYGTSGAPSHASIVDSVMRFAPVPSSSYDLKMTYWVSLQSLSAEAPTNWLIEGHPDIYLVSGLLELAPYVKDPNMISVWKEKREEALEELHQYTDRHQFSGKMRARPKRAIGG